MQVRVKIFTFISGHGETVVGPAHEDSINRWLESIDGEILTVCQSESERPGVGHHVTLTVWYMPGNGRV
jgi:hypothetical protein